MTYFRHASLVAIGFILTIAVWAVWFSFSLRKYEKSYQNRKSYQDLDELISQGQNQNDGVARLSREDNEDKRDCQFGFEFLKKFLKPIDNHESPGQDIIQPSRGGLRQGALCLDSADGADNDPVQIIDCHGQGRNQEWKITINNMIENVGQESMCLEAEPKVSKTVVLRLCDKAKPNQKWNFNGRKGRFSPGEHTDLCLENSKKQLIVSPCVDKGKQSQMFEFIMTEIMNLEDSLHNL